MFGTGTACEYDKCSYRNVMLIMIQYHFHDVGLLDLEERVSAKCGKGRLYRNGFLIQSTGTIPAGTQRGTSAAKTGRSLNYPAGNFGAGIAGGLRGKIIWTVMEDNHFSDDILDQKAVGQKCGYCKAIIPEQRRQVARMVGVLTILWVVM